ncbi:MAG: acetyl-CoA C-acetyltransferase [Chloroflexi bacterium]|uniref:acetyl-CoA C-acyltransferase n=1 Tax=Candidatus Chlorohelix allophototropha TaxID=3003348 RepID=A0A8T7LRP0_9CHLR|nr:acetyl-CoA C-acetyltransferase [Chloroflexota bacterium]WJW66547.1 acetyl-CoA C-acetyltransferase [Chloroflexota bacterium L227-S17]
MEEAVIVSAVRTPIGRYGGALATVRPDNLGAIVIAEAIRRTGIEASMVEDVIFGCANQSGEDNRNVARMSLLLAGLPIETAGVTVNRLCGSGLQAVNDAARAIKVGEGEVLIAGGVESMTRAPFVMAKPTEAWQRGNPTLHDTTLGWRFINPRLSEMYYPYNMGETAENVVDKYKISREDQDLFAYNSQKRATNAIGEGKFKAEIVPVKVPQRKGEPFLFDTDEHPRADTTLEALAKLKPAFRKDGTVTAGNSSGINDGAAALVLMSGSKAAQLGLKPLARIVTSAVAGVDPATMGLGPIPASRKALQRAGLTVADLDLIEINEAFASQSLACMRELGLDPEKVNVNGGAIALGHPLGCSGARMLTTLLYEMERRGSRYGLATMCIGVGQGIATIIERL